MKVFITGGHGFIGSHTVQALLEAGHSVRCLVRAESDTQRLDGLDCEKVVGDMRDEESLRSGLEGCDAIVHLASPSAWSVINSPAMRATVVDGTKSLLDLAKENHVERMVFCSSIMAVGYSKEPKVFDEASPYSVEDPTFNYCHCKHEAEELCKAAAADGLGVCIVNPAETYGPNDITMTTAGNLVDFAKSWPVMVCTGGTCVAFVEDVALGVVAALERGEPGERYILGNENLTVRQLAELTLDILGRKAPVMGVPNGLLKGITKAATKLRVPLPFEADVVPYATNYWFMDGSKVRDELGVEFRDARATLEPTIAWLKESGKIT